MGDIENFDWELIAKHLNKEISDHEKAELKAWLSKSQNQAEVEQTQTMLDEIDTFYQAKQFDSQKAWTNVNAQLNPQQKNEQPQRNVQKRFFATFYKYAAVVVVALLLGTIGYYVGFRNEIPAGYNQLVSENSQILNEYVLPDGSVVSLNSNSKLLYPEQFEGDIREVTIIGEAFFDVKRNPEKPFVINAGDAQVKVLGTSFNVCAYPGAKTVEVVVKTGKVQVINTANVNPDDASEVFLTPGEKGTLFTGKQLLEKSVNSNPNFLSWKTQHLIFDEVPLSEVVRCLEKTYHISVELAEPELNDLVYKGHFDEKPVEFVLDVIRLTFNLDVAGENKHYTLKSRINSE